MIANKTSSGEELVERLQEKAAAGERHLFIAVVPQQDGHGAAPREARARLEAMLERLHAAGLLSSGMIGDPDPYTAAMNALELFRVDDVVISTLPDERSGWMRANLIERVRGATTVPVEHVVVDLQRRTRLRPPRGADGEAAWRPPASPTAGGHASSTPTEAQASTTARRRPTAARAWTRSCSGCCFSSSPRS